MPYKCPIKRRESAKERQRRYREKNREKINIKAVGRYHKIYKKDDESVEKAKERSRVWRLKNKERVKSYLARNPDQREKARKRVLEWQKKNKGKVRANNALRKKRVRMAMPSWANRSEISDIYDQAVQMEKNNGEKYHVDHIIPLVNDKVCGLHIPANLRIIRAEDNLAKGNKF